MDQPPVSFEGPPGPRPSTVAQLCDCFESWAHHYYRKRSGRPTGHAEQMHYALRPLRTVAGAKHPSDLAAEDLCACQSLMISGGLSRKVINARINRIRQVIRWATMPPRRWIPRAVLEDLRDVESLRRGRSAAKERPKVKPVTWDQVSATMPWVPRQVAIMIELQWHSGMRPGELCAMRKSELEHDGEDFLWYYPSEHKTDHYGERREILIGPVGKRILMRWIRAREDDRLFDYTAHGYRCAVARGARNAGVKHWFPNQLRHAFGTRAASQHGLWDTKPLMGHTDVKTTQRYADLDRDKWREIMRDLG